MAAAGRIDQALFSLCFGHDGGYMTFGDYDKSRHLARAPVHEFSFERAGQFKIRMRGLGVS